jgi:hypothetical protein
MERGRSRAHRQLHPKMNATVTRLGGVMQHRRNQEAVAGMHPVAEERGKAVRTGFRARRPDPKHDLAEELAPGGHDEIQMVQHLGREHGASFIYQLVAKPSNPPIDRKLRSNHAGLLDLAVPAVGGERERSHLDGVVIRTGPARRRERDNEDGYECQPRPAAPSRARWDRLGVECARCGRVRSRSSSGTRGRGVRDSVWHNPHNSGQNPRPADRATVARW